MPLVPRAKQEFQKMNKHRYTLASNKVKKLNCPYCGAKKHWQRYIDIETGEVLPEEHGRCDNTDKCGEWVKPKETGYAKMIWEHERGNHWNLKNNWKPQSKKVIIQPTVEPVFFDFNTFKRTLEADRYVQNTFVQNLLENVSYPFEVEDVTKVIQLYRLGTVSKGYRAGAITFPFIDINQNVRTIQVKQFDETNHTTGTDFLHSIIEKYHTINDKPWPEWLEAYKKQDKRVSCLFGEHLLSKYHSNPIALVEAPKTAIYGTLYFGLPETPESLIWLAVYNKSSFSFDKLKALKGRDVYVFPDLSKDGATFKEWEAKAKQFERQIAGIRFKFSDLLEELAPERARSEGDDLADFLIKLDWRTFRKKNIKEQVPKPKISEAPKTIIYSSAEIQKENQKYIDSLKIEGKNIISFREYPATWDYDDKSLSKETRDFVRMAEKNKSLIEMKNNFKISIV
jgi:glutaredoxin